MVGDRKAEPRAQGEVLTDPAQHSRIRGILALGGVPWDQLDDGVQQVRLKLLESRRGTAIRNETAWLAVVATRVAADWHRSRSRDTALRDRLEARWSRSTDGHPQEERLLALSVAEGLEDVPTAQRQVLVLRFYADLALGDIARLLDIPEGTVKSRLHSGVAALRTTLRERKVI
ncbi:RNA polymerase sigma factor [Streptomyces sp. UC4497]